MQKPKGIVRFILFSAIVMALLQFGIASFNAQSATGVSNIALSQASVTIYPSNSLLIPFSVSLVSGTPGHTTVSITNGQILNNKGVSLAINNASGTPDFGGSIYIITNTYSYVVPGTYVLQVQTKGADTSQTYNLTINLMGYGVSPTTSASVPSTILPATVASTTIASASSTITQVPGSSNTNLAIGAIIVIIIIIVVIVLVVRERKHY